jgi:hypothetical protein
MLIPTKRPRFGQYPSLSSASKTFVGNQHQIFSLQSKTLLQISQTWKIVRQFSDEQQIEVDKKPQKQRRSVKSQTTNTFFSNLAQIRKHSLIWKELSTFQDLLRYAISEFHHAKIIPGNRQLFFLTLFQDHQAGIYIKKQSN